ncbi:hypothetical protein QCA50_009268 [Cerrena zonata]|uniref:Uncharacterized protein n=1 Tax=Cerrena zonata TaxID=2478898 RepID=A0AAW0G233_9APHY
MEFSCSRDKLGVPSFNKQILILKYSPDNEVAVTNEEEFPPPDFNSDVDVTVFMILVELPFPVEIF